MGDFEKARWLLDTKQAIRAVYEDVLVWGD